MSWEESAEIRRKVLDALLRIVESATDPVSHEAAGGLSRSYTTVADRLEAVRLLKEIGVI